jgi:acetyl/propionyl-CoA carboxylase alpha subunit
MHYELEVGGRVRQVTVIRTGAIFAVTVDGRTRQVDAARVSNHTLSLVDDTMWSTDVTISADGGPGELTVLVGTTPVPVTINGRRRGWNRGDRSGSGSGPQRVIAPMPGKVVRVVVKIGDVVVARQPVIVVEAMKMENELRSARDGRVAEVHVEEGASVERGQLLIVIQ